ncbi:hypothetical protein ACFFLS_07155 [Flavobacterium procerum]|uniref:Uncharacterized protein n=1 Tax=Flavobacterium procerum TaxID=1455569 RepID=A0ABV6BQA3_9FLAO
MGTSISLGDYEPERIPEPWEESQYRSQRNAYYAQSIDMDINNLSIVLQHLHHWS